MVITKENNNVIKLSIGFFFVLLFFYAINPLTRTNIGIYLLFSMVAVFIYSRVQYQSTLIGIGKKNLFWSIALAFILGGTYYFASKIPGMSLATPLLPNAISDQLRFFIIVLVAPICEEILFRGALLGYIREFNPSSRKIWFAIGISAVTFSLFHLASYISGFYALPGFTQGFSAISDNISSFISAFIFGIIAGFIVTRNGIKNLWFAILFHMLVNFIIYSSLTIGIIG